MGDTSIEWTDKTWNPIRGCSRVSAGCERCYAETMAGRFSGPGQAFEGLTRKTPTGARWTGKVRLVPEHLADPLRWKKPRRVFVNSMSDLFHEGLGNEDIAAVFGVMAAAPQHTFQVLTKRPERMREVLSREDFPGMVQQAADRVLVAREIERMGRERMKEIAGYPGYYVTDRGVVLTAKRGEARPMSPDESEQGHQRVQLHREGGGERGDRHLVHRLVLEAFVGPAPSEDAQGCHRDGNPRNNALPNLRWGSQSDNWLDRKRHGNGRSYAKLDRTKVVSIQNAYRRGASRTDLARIHGVSDTQITNIVTGAQWEHEATWPLPWVWLGVSVEDQATADERIPLLLETPAAVRFVSAEPLLSSIDLRRYLGDGRRTGVSVHGGAGLVRGDAARIDPAALPVDAGRDANAGPGRSPAGGVQRVGRLPDGHVSGRAHAAEGVRAPDRLDGGEPCGHPVVDAGEPHRRRSGEPAPVEPGTRDALGEREARDPGAGPQAEGAGRRGQRAGEAHRDAGHGDSRAVGRAGAVAVGAGGAVQREAEHDLRDRPAQELEAPRLDWVIAGAESGPRARAAELEWFRSVRDQCAAAGVAFFMKQWTGPEVGTMVERRREDDSRGKTISLPVLDGRQHADFPR